MALIFEYEKELQTGSQPFISPEANSELFNYYIENELAMDKRAKINSGNYESVAFSHPARHLTTKAVSRIGIKNFPGIGGIGFYKDAYSDESAIVAPIHPEQREYKAPVLTKVEIVDNKLHIVITPPSDLNYTCYRVVVQQGAFAFEYIMYKTDYYVDVPTVKGDYVVYCMGYDEDNGTVSEDSNELTLNVPTGTDDWSPYFVAIADLEKNMKVLNSDMDELQNTVADLDASVDDLDERVKTLEGLEPSQFEISSISASSYYGAGFEPELAIDDDTTTRWASADKNSGTYLLLDLGSEKEIKYMRSMCGASYVQEDFVVYFSSDNVTFNKVADVSLTSGETFVETALEGTARYLKLEFTSTVNASFFELREVQVFGY